MKTIDSLRRTQGSIDGAAEDIRTVAADIQRFTQSGQVAFAVLSVVAVAALVILAAIAVRKDSAA